MSEINNAIYSEMGERWYQAKDDPVALLRAETKYLIKYVRQKLSHNQSLKILDVGCGAGFKSNALATDGHHVTGVDMAQDALRVARLYDKTNSVHYAQMDAYALDLPDESFDVVLAMDFFEHVDPDRAIKEISRVLKPGGELFFNTFAKNPLAWLVCIKGVEWFVANTPKDLHVIDMFISPGTLKKILARHKLKTLEVQGLRPKLNPSFFKMLKTKTVDDGFEFTKAPNAWMGYYGHSQKQKT